MQRYIDKLKANKNIVLYGCGSMSYRVLAILLQNAISPVAVVDGASAHWGKRYIFKDYETIIISYEELRQRYSEYTILLAVSIKYAIEIRTKLERKGEKNPIFHMQCPFKIDDVLLNGDDELYKLQEYFADYESRQIFAEFLRYKASGDMEKLLKYCSGNTYFDATILRTCNDHKYIDVGCYTGDTIAQFMLFVENGYSAIVGMDADPGNSERAKQMIKYARLKNTTIINMGGWDRKTTMVLHTLKDKNARNFDSPNFFRNSADIIDGSKALIEDNVYEDVDIECDSLDNLFYELRPSIIKINALAADYNILLGARKIIRDCAPDIVMDYGARPAFIKKTVDFLKSFGVYNLYLREKEIFGDYKTIIYAVRK